MKPRSFFSGRIPTGAFALTLIAFAGSHLQAATYTKLFNTTRIDSVGSWSGGPPTTADTALFDSTITGALTTASLSGNYFMGAIQVTNIGGPVTIGVDSAGASTALAINGIDMSSAAGNLTFGNVVDGGTVRLNSASGSVSFNVASGRTLTFNSRFQNQGNTKTLTLTGPGNIVFNSTSGSGGAMSFSIQGGSNVTMNGAGSWSTLNEIINGTLNIGADTALGGNNLNLGGTSANTPTLIASGGARTIANNLTLLSVTTGTATIAGSNALIVNGSVTASGAARTLTVNNSALTTLGGNVFLSNDNTTSARGLTINGTGNTTISGVIANNNAGNTLGAALTYSGSGTLNISNANTYSGTTTISSGTVKVGTATSLGQSRVNISNGAILDLNGTNLSLNFLNNGAALNGGIVDNVSAGGNITLTVGGNQGGITGASTTYTNIDTFSGIIKNTTGTVGLTKTSPALANQSVGIMATASLPTGANLLRLTNQNTYTGDTTIKGGILNLEFLNANNGGAAISSNIVSSSSKLVLQGGDLLVTSAAGTTTATQTFASTTLNAGASHVGTFRNSSQTVTTALGGITRNVGSSLDFQFRPSGASSNQKIGGGDGTNTTTTANANFTGGSQTILGGYATFNGNTWAVSGSGASPGTITGLGTYSTTFTAGTNVDDTTAGSVTPASMTINSLRFNTAVASSVDTTGNLTIATGGILETSTVGANAVSINNNNLTSNNGQDLIVIQNNTLGGMTIGSNITGGIGLTKSGLGSLTLTPNTANTLTGQLTINGGTVILGNANALNSNEVVFGGTSQTQGGNGVFTFTNGTLQLNGNSNSVGSLTSSTDSSGTAKVQNAGGSAVSNATLTINSGTSASYAGTLIDGTGGGTLALTKTGSGTQTLTNNASSFTGEVNIGGGILVINASNNNTNPTTSGLGNVQVSRNINVNNGGTLRFDAGDTFGGAASVVVSTLVINSGGTVTNNGAAFTTLGPLTLNGSTLTGTGGSGNTQFQMYAFGGDVTVGGSSASTISGSGTTASYHLGTSASGRTSTTFTVADATSSSTSDLDVSAVLMDRTGGLGAASLTKAGAGTMTLSGVNTYTGVTAITAGTLQVDGSTALGSQVNVGTAGTLSGTGTVNGNATLTGSGVINKSSGTIAGTLAVAGGNWNGNGAVNGAVTSSSSTFNIGSGANLTANGDLNVTGGSIAAGSSSSTITGNVNYTSVSSSTYQGVVAGSGKTLTMNNSASTLTLSGTSTYTGATTVSAGSLLVNGALGNTAVTVSGTATLGGTGSIGGTVSIGGTGKLSAGASIESLSSGNLSMTSGTTFVYEVLNNSSTGADLMAVNGTLSLTAVTLGLDSTSLTALASGSFLANDKITLISYEYNGATEVTSGFTGYTDGSTYAFGSNQWQFDYNDLVAGGNFGSDAVAGGQDRFVTMTLVPEPGAAFLGGLGVLTLLRRRRR